MTDAIICLGYRRGEILPPYQEGVCRPHEDLERIRQFVKEHPEVKKFGSAAEFAMQLETDRHSIEALEIMGAWANQCVPSSITNALYYSIECRVNPALVAVYSPRTNDAKRNALTEAVGRMWRNTTRNGMWIQRDYRVFKKGEYIVFQPIQGQQ